MKIRVWRYVVQARSAAEFEQVYGPKGAWARLFSLADGYVGTELYRDVGRLGHYVTVDTFVDDESWRQFLLEHRAAYDELDAKTSDLTLEEQELV